MHALISSFLENISFYSVIIGLLGTIISFKLFLPLFISLKFLINLLTDLIMLGL